MDVRCERCSAEYALEDGRITEAGVSVQCSRCGNVFVVRRKAVVFTEPSPAIERRPLPLSVAGEKAWGERGQQWRVRQASGNLITFRELTTLQKWIVERKLSRDDEVSLDGESWKRLGSIDELSSFFQLVDEAQKATLFERPSREPASASAPKEASQPIPPKEPSVVVSLDEPAKSPNRPSTSAPRQSRASVQFEDFSFPKAGPSGPAPRFGTSEMAGLKPVPAEPTFTGEQPSIGSRSDSIEAIAGALKARPNRSLSIVLLLAFLGGVSYLAYRYFVWVPQRQAQFEASQRSSAAPVPREVAKPDQLASEAALPPPEVSTSTRASESTPARAEQAELAKLAAQAAPSKSAEAAAPAEASPPTKESAKPAAVAPAKPEEGVNFDSYMDRADRLREREQPRAALRAYRKANELEPARPEPLAGQGLALLDLGQTAPAIAAFEQALKTDPRYGLALMGLAEAYRAEGKKEQAMRYYEKYLAVVPDGPEAQVAKAAIKALHE